MSGPTGDWPAFQRQAITFQYAGFSFTLPNNYVQYQDVGGTVVTNRPSVGGTVTFVWTKDLRTFTLSGITGREGITPWTHFRDLCQGQICAYTNTLDGTALPVLVKTVTFGGNGGQGPNTWTWEIECQEAVQFQPANSASTRRGGPQYV